MNLILLGPPGAGKGTQSCFLQKKYHLVPISTGDLLRDEVRRKTPLGLEVEDIMAQGKFPSDDIILRIFKARFQKVKDQGVILDGVPRTLFQAQKIDEIFKEEDATLDAVIQLDVDEEDLIHRLGQRRVCPDCGMTCRCSTDCPQCGCACLTQRPDDTPEAIKTRLEVYNDCTKPLIEYYGKKGLLKIVKGMESVEDVSAQIDSLLESLKKA